MAQPTPQDVHIDAALSNISIAYKPVGMVADMVFPSVPVDKQSDYYYVRVRQHNGQLAWSSPTWVG